MALFPLHASNMRISGAFSSWFSSLPDPANRSISGRQLWESPGPGAWTTPESGERLLFSTRPIFSQCCAKRVAFLTSTRRAHRYVSVLNRLPRTHSAARKENLATRIYHSRSGRHDTHARLPVYGAICILYEPIAASCHSCLLYTSPSPRD